MKYTLIYSYINSFSTTAVALINKSRAKKSVVMQYLRMLFCCSATYNPCIKAFHITLQCPYWSCLLLVWCHLVFSLFTVLTWGHCASVLSISCSASHVLSFTCIFSPKGFSFWSVCPTFCFFFLFLDFIIHGLLQDVLHFYKAANAPTIRQSFKTFCNTYIRFCDLSGICSILIQIFPPSVCGVIFHFVGLLHKDMNLPNPVSNNWCL